jgi:hypothetical protein
VINTKNLSGTAKSGLDLIGDQQYSILVTELPQSWPVIIRRFDGSGFTLDWFNNDTGYAVSNLFGSSQFLLNGIRVTEGNLTHASQQGQ